MPVRPATRAWARRIIAEVESEHGLAPGEIAGPRRQKYIVEARREAIRRVWIECPTFSLPAVGRIFNRDHTTILHALRSLWIVTKREERA